MGNFMKRKGVSPLIAAVLLIAFTMAIAAILTAWITQFTTEQKEKSEVFEEKIACAYANIKADRDLTIFNGTHITSFIENTGTQVVDIIKVQIWLAGAKQKPKDLPSSVGLNVTDAADATADLDTLYGVDVTADNLDEVRFTTNCENVFTSIKKPTTGWRTS